MTEYTVSIKERAEPCTSIMDNRHVAVGLVSKSIDGGVNHAVAIDRTVTTIDTDKDFIRGSGDGIILKEDIDLTEDGAMVYAHSDLVHHPITVNDVKTVFSNNNGIHTVCALSQRDVGMEGFSGIAIHCISMQEELSEDEYKSLIQSVEETTRNRIPKLVSVFGEYCSHAFTVNIEDTKYPLGLTERFYR